MSMMLGEAKAAARGLQNQGDYPGALKAYLHLLTHVAGDSQLRFGIADLMVKLGLNAEAAHLYRGLALHALTAGYPLRALVAAHALSALGQSGDDVLRALSETYGAGSVRLGRFAPAPVPSDPAQQVPEGAPDLRAMDELVDAAMKQVSDLSHAEAERPELQPVPFLSTLSPPELLEVLRTLSVQRLAHKDMIFRQGDPGSALYLVAGGEAVVFTTDATGKATELARLRENTMFGEMALLTDQPRTASVMAVERADIIEVSRAALEMVARRIPGISALLDRFARERLIKNLLATSPLFTPFTAAQQADLLQRFEGQEYATGAEIIGQGREGTGLFVVLSGVVEVSSSSTSGTSVALARLKCGEVFGEMSLLTKQPTNATVRAASPATVLFLNKDYFARLVTAIDELRSYFAQLVAARATQADMLLGRRAVPSEAAPDPDADQAGDRILI